MIHIINPENYDFCLSLQKVLTDIYHQQLNIDITVLKEDMYKFKVRQFLSKINKIAPYIKYDMYGTKTGRLATQKNSFPILTMDKNYRKILKPNNDWFIEFDFNAAELRVLLGLLGKEQPQEDIHEWNLKNVYRGIGTREEAKKRIFAWLYNPKSKDYLSNRAYDRDSVVQKYFNGGQVSTFFTRTIKADEHHALNYIIQSTAADLFLRPVIKIWNLLQERETKIVFCLHDAVIIDFSEKDIDILLKLKKTFADTEMGTFLVNTKVGKNFGEMKKLGI